METITKAKIAESLRSTMGFSGVICEDIVNSIFESIVEILNTEEKLVIKNFGKFRINNKKERPGQNIKTKEQVMIPPKTVLRFIPSAQLKNKLNSYEAKIQ
jgi:integration host factor subunit alpha